ncbi:MBG domain-containing protein [Algoriphagus limi]|uniref:YDG domain-containing protein n=1 Tax=Algoriphagus limi TaxID=2975273 RepID=A0ABT2GCW1_9BACT|nr:MBG domain-containing protein [Algoriphagus limi]MCS5491767.1 YDG domain-containing protein [Algoriphagus limi]
MKEVFMKSLIIFICLITIHFQKLIAQPTIGTTTFDGINQNIAPFGALPRSGVVAGWSFFVNGSGSGAINHNGANSPSNVNVFVQAASTINIGSSDGSEFDFDNFRVQFFSFAGSFTITAYKDGASQGSVTATASSTYTEINLSANSNFNNIDEIRLSGFGGSNVTLNVDEITISAASIPNTPPTASSFTVSNGPFENLTYTFSTSDFGYSDSDGDPLDNIRVESVPSAGTLYVDADNDDTYDAGEEMLVNYQVSRADLDAGNFQYIQNGSTSTSFQFEVSDGTIYSTGNYLATLNVLPIPTVILSLSPSSRTESTVAPTSVSATLSNVYGTNTVVNLVFSGTATGSGVDYFLSGTSITITPGNTTGSVNLTNVPDALYEGNETVVIDISTVTNGIESGTQQQTYTITDDDPLPNATLEILNIYNPITDESGGQAYVRGKINAVAGVTISIPLSFTGTATGGGTDYSITGSTITLSPGQLMDSIRITSQFDGLIEGDETVIIDMAPPTNAVEVGTQQVTLTITDEDFITPEFSINDPSVSEGNSGATTLTFTVSLSSPAPAGGATVDYTTSDGTAIAGSDYTAASGTLSFSAGETSKTIDVTISGDQTVETGETLIFQLSNPTGTGVVIGDASGTGTITNDDQAIVTIANVSGNEDDGAITVTATLDNAVDGGFTVDVSTADGTATTADNDYVALNSQTLTFAGAAGEMNTFTITPTADATPEPDESVIVSMSNLVPTIVASGDIDITDGATVTILNDEETPTIVRVDVPNPNLYVLGRGLGFEVIFSEDIYIFNSSGTSPTMVLNIGGSLVEAQYLYQGLGRNSASFRYIIGPADLDLDGIEIVEIKLNGSYIRSISTNFDANLTLNNVGNTSQVLVDAVTPSDFEKISFEGNLNSSTWGDYDMDGDLDMLVTGNITTQSGIEFFSEVYRNDAGNFVNINAGLEGVRSSSLAWGDHDGDGDLDILLTGFNSNSIPISKIYRNDEGSFIDIDAGLEGIWRATAIWGDYDGDGDLDLFLSGWNSDNIPIAKIYRNDAGNYNDINAEIEGNHLGSAAWGDYDGDGDLDLLISGVGLGLIKYSRIYRNDSGNFVDINAGLEGVGGRSSVAWGDFDGDGDLDVLLSGFNSNNVETTSIYRNDGGNFIDIHAGLIGASFPLVAWGDYDGDGDLDILLKGFNSSLNISRIYRNDSGSFSIINFEGYEPEPLSWGDFDSDGDLDIVIGDITLDYLNSQGYFSIYKNNSVENSVSYSAPSAPNNLSSSVDAEAKAVTLTWDPSTDNTTPTASLSYNVYIREKDQNNYIVSPHALESNGWRLLSAMGNAQLGTEYVWNYPEEALGKTFEWKVQAIDNSYMGGEFSLTENFEIKKPLLAISGYFEVSDKIYDGSKSAVLTSNSLALEGLKSGATDVIISNIQVEFEDKNAGPNKLVKIIDVTLSGTDAERYSLDLDSSPTASATISPRSLVVSGLSALDKVYDGTKLANLSGTAVVTGIGADDVYVSGSALGNFTQAEVGTAISVTVTGLTLDGADRDNYEIIYPSGLQASIKKAELFITANPNQSKVFGDIDPVLTFTSSGFQGADTNAILTGTLNRSAGENIGSYPINLGTLDAGPNYSITFISANFTIASKVLEIKAVPNQSKVFGEADPSFPYTIEGFEFGDSKDILTGSLGRAAGEDVGIYAINLGTLNAGPNYAINFTGADFEITPATITGITFGDGSFVYDGTAKSLAISGTLPAGTSVTYTNNSRTDVGTQEVTATISGSNFTTLELKADLTITPAPITGITFGDGSFVYDGTAKSLAISGTLPEGTTVAYTNNSRTDVGMQEVTATISGSNYTTLVLTADLTISPAEIEGITFADGSFVYDGEEKSLQIEGDLPEGTSVDYTDNGRTDVGTQEVTAIISGSNYVTLELTAELTITPAEITGLSFLDQSFVYDGQEKNLAVTGDIPQGATVSYENNGRTNTGSQEVTATIGGSNYTSLELEATLEITPATLAITANPGQSKLFGQSDPVLTYSASGFAPGEDVSILTGSLEREAGEAVGFYAINLGSLSAGDNYTISYTGAEFEIITTDSDGDGVPDDVELEQGTDPKDPNDYRDSDGDGVPDFVENEQGTDPTDGEDFKDSDGDGVPDYVEEVQGTSPTDPEDFLDSDGDGVPDHIQLRSVIDVIPQALTVEWGTLVDELELSTEVMVITGTGDMMDLPVVWDLTNYNPLVNGVYIFFGEFTLPEGLFNTYGLKAQLSIEILPKPAPQDVTLSSAEFLPVQGQFFQEIGVFTVIDPSDDQHILSLPEGFEDNDLFEVIDGILFWSSSEQRPGETQFEVLLQVEDRAGNIIQKTFLITRQRIPLSQLEVTNTFTPNGDGINDTWGLPQLRYYKGVRIMVYDKDYRRLFYTEDADVRWDGTFNGIELSVGAYFWVIEVVETGEVRRGVLNLLRR